MIIANRCLDHSLALQCPFWKCGLLLVETMLRTICRSEIIHLCHETSFQEHENCHSSPSLIPSPVPAETNWRWCLDIFGRTRPGIPNFEGNSEI